MNKTVAGLVFVMTLTLSPPIGAHTDEHFESVEAPHGGQLRTAGPFHLELVAKDGDLTLYVTDHADHPISVDGGLAKANIENGSRRIPVNLHPVGSNILRGTGGFSLSPSTVVVIFMKLPHQDSYAARFIPLQPKGKQAENASPHADDGGHHHHHLPKD